MKQTVVEWLFQELDNYYQMKGNVIKKEILKQAKEMEKQNIKSARHNGRQDFRDNGAMYKEDEQYYNETFKQ